MFWDAADIQGNSLAGFKERHQMFLFAVIDDVTRQDVA